MTTALDRAHAVVSNYGDPTVTWSIVVDAELTEALELRDVEARLAELGRSHTSLGDAPVVTTVPTGAMDEQVVELANQPYVDDQLVRCVCADDGLRVLVAAHHGVVDGLGLVAVLGAAMGIDLVTSARGIRTQPAAKSFYTHAPARLIEALWSPPARLRRGASHLGLPGDLLRARTVAAAGSAGTVATARAVLSAYASLAGESRRSAVLAIGASRRRSGEVLTPDRQTAYLRLRARRGEEAAGLLRGLAPEPDFPTRPAGRGLVPIVVRLLKDRLGSTATISNLGIIRSPQGSPCIATLRFYPCAVGPGGLAVGVATVGSSTTITVRGKADDFSARVIDDLLGTIASSLSGQ